MVAPSRLANCFCQQISRKKWKNPSHFLYRLCCKSRLTRPGSSSTCHFSFPHSLLCQRICLLKIHSGLSCGLTPRLLQVVRCSGCFSDSKGIKVQGKGSTLSENQVPLDLPTQKAGVYEIKKKPPKPFGRVPLLGHTVEREQTKC